jgi:hypothetical protein
VGIPVAVAKIKWSKIFLSSSPGSKSWLCNCPWDHCCCVGEFSASGFLKRLTVANIRLMNHFVFPRHCRLIFLSRTSKILGKFNELYISHSKFAPPSLSSTKAYYSKFHYRQLINGTSSTSPDERRLMKLEDDILASLVRADTLIDMMQLEICILPVRPSYRADTAFSQLLHSRNRLKVIDP